MALTEKGKNAIYYIKEFFPKGQFTAKDLSDACGEKIVAATLNGVANNGYIVKLGGSPIMYEATAELELYADEDAPKSCDKTNLEKAKAAKDDDFYTRYEDIEVELMRYKKYFKNKVIFLPCDDHNPEKKFINFWDFFVNNFEAFGLKKLIATHYSPEGNAYKIWLCEDLNGDGYIDEDDVQSEFIDGIGAFNDPACTEILEECDIVITNPPFSCFIDFVDWIISHNKQCIIIGRQTAFSYQSIFKLMQENKLWTGYNKVKKFYRPDNTIKEFGNICWFTNLLTTKRYDKIVLTQKYIKEKYPKYDNYDAINVDRVADIPNDYHDVMGVPVTFLEKYNPNQFQIIGLMASTSITDVNFGYPYVNGKKKFARVLIKEI